MSLAHMKVDLPFEGWVVKLPAPPYIPIVRQYVDGEWVPHLFRTRKAARAYMSGVRGAKVVKVVLKEAKQ